MGWANQRLYEAEPEQWKENLNRARGHGGHGGRGFGVAYRLTIVIYCCVSPAPWVWVTTSLPLHVFRVNSDARLNSGQIIATSQRPHLKWM